MKPAGGVDDHHVLPPGAGRPDGVERHRRGISTLLPRDHLHPEPISPRLQLGPGGGTERVSSGEHHSAAVVLEPGGQLGDGRRLAGPVDAHHQDHCRLALEMQRPVLVAELCPQLGSQRLTCLFRRLGAGRPDPGHHRGRCLQTDIGAKQRLLEVIPGVVVETGAPCPAQGSAECGGTSPDPGGTLGLDTRRSTIGAAPANDHDDERHHHDERDDDEDQCPFARSHCYAKLTSAPTTNVGQSTRRRDRYRRRSYPSGRPRRTHPAPS